jgi:hypothetical protein
MIIRIGHKPNGGTRTLVSYKKHDGQQAIAEIEKLLKDYPESGWSDVEGPWARDAEGRKYTFATR